MKIGFIGNFIPQYSTENDRRWTLSKMGHDVYAFQENQTTPEILIEYASKLDLLFYSHTHDPDYVIPDLIDVFRLYKKKGVPTASIHLDKWVGLDRVKDVGKEATWFTEYIFMADGSDDAAKMYDSLKLNWFYLPAGVVERDCYITPPDPVNYPHEIVFTGSKGYHPEYPFRPQLIEFLHKTYGDRFAHYGNDGIKVVRGHELNTLYSTAKVVVGDSCFGGQNNYVSDRYYEVRGRGGVLLHPYVKGVDTVGVTNYEQGNLDSLKENIDYLLENHSLRGALRRGGNAWVMANETYTNRMEEVFKIING